MKENENKKPTVRVTDGSPAEASEVPQENAGNKIGKLKKPVIFILMGIVFLGCMYLIFGPSQDKKKVENIGLNDAVPQATDAGLQADKQKAYEQEMLEQKNREKQNALASLSDYWNTEEKEDPADEPSPGEEENYEPGSRNNGSNGNPGLSSYRNMQNTLGSFYQDNSSETIELRKQLDELKAQLAEKDVPPVATVDDQLKLMEKSYEMAAKYLPQNANGDATTSTNGSNPVIADANSKANWVAFTPVKKSVVSSLPRNANFADSVLAGYSQTKNPDVYTIGGEEQAAPPRNSIKACVHETKTVIGETGVRIRLLEPAQIPGRVIPEGTVLTANAKFQQGRLQLKVASIELDGNILPVDISIYDLDGQQGLFVPYSPEMNAFTEMASNMAQNSGTSFMMTQSAGQQVAADLSRGVVQGVSGYFAKKIRTPKVTLKAGHQLFLVSKN
jgi:conjugative transposon TraM protein